MKIEAKYQIEKAVSKDPTRVDLGQVRYDPEHRCAVATDGYMMAVVPATVEETEPASVSRSVFAAARKLARATKCAELRIAIEPDRYVLGDGSTCPRPPAASFPPYRDVFEAVERSDTPPSSVTLDPHKLLALAQALGVKKGGGVTLIVRGTLDAIEVECGFAHGLLMPMRP